MSMRAIRNEFRILDWLKERGAKGSASVDEIATHFQVPKEIVQKHLERLQRMESVKRAGPGRLEWSITETGLGRVSLGMDAFERQASIFSLRPRPTTDDARPAEPQLADGP